eukprot:CAMPEP_0114993628 /NCGR_PEP_ID=MMETSP0216-20121206/12645_1 /TAXON_ID=223996 /ORGANISM="Protocruzia adherens, Strain Boccale" /LENGTH=488 /DNA_ID=CAMNT_0002357311 /DNA_START=43 /DNA_END=1509 /DNA_ORIENTATION=+
MCDNWKLTAELFGSLISRPRMTEKHLTKPPFRYLADIVLETMSVTGYAQGLYEGDDLVSKAITDRDAKVLWLDKIIKVTCYAKGEKIDIKATKVIAGLEPEKTNSFLQIMHECATSGKDTSKIVAKVRAKLEGAAQKQEEDDGKTAAAAEDEEEKEKEAERRRRAAEKKRRQEEKAEQERLAKEQEEQAERERAAEEESRAAEKDRRRKEKEEEKKRRADEKRRAEEKAAADEEEAAATTASKQKNRVERPTTASKRPAKVSSNTKEVDSRIDKSRVPQGVIRDDDDDDDDNDMIIQNEDNDALGSGIRLDDVDRQKQGKFVRNAMQEHDDQTREDEARKVENENKGGIKMSMPSRKKAKQGQLGGKVDSKDRGGMSQNDLEYMRKAIQALCQATNPLGKSMEFVQDDIESMTKENEYWRKEYGRSQARLDEEMRVTEESLQPMYDKLAEVEERIREQVSKINNVRAQIIKNDATVQNLLSGVVNPRQ